MNVALKSTEFKDYIGRMKSSTEKSVAVFNALQSNFTAMGLTDSSFKNLVQIGTDDTEFFTDPFIVLPRLAELSEWLIYPSKNTNIYLSKLDDVFRSLFEVFCGDVIGDGMIVKSMDDDDPTIIDEDETKICADWLKRPCGASPDNRGKTTSSWIIPMIIFDSLTCGGSGWHKFIGYRPVSPEEEVGELMIRYLDPRTIVSVSHDYFGWKKLVQVPIVQWGLPETRADFEKWNPVLRNRYQNRIIGQTVEQDPVSIPSNEFYWFNLFLWPPISAVIQKIISKLTLQFLQDKFVDKATYPFFVVSIPRNYQVNPDDDEFLVKLQEVAETIAQYRSGDVLCIEGENYDISNTGEKVTLSEGWVIQPLSIKEGSIDFESAFRTLNEGIAHGVLSSMAEISSIGVQGRTSSLSTGGQINANLSMIRKNTRRVLADEFQYVFQDLLFLKTGKKKDLANISIEFTKTREEDAAQWLNQIISFHGAGAIDTNELRNYGSRIGMDLKPLPLEMTPEGQQMLGIEEIMAETTFQIPQSWLNIESPEIELDQVREELKEEEENIKDQAKKQASAKK